MYFSWSLLCWWGWGGGCCLLRAPQAAPRPVPASLGLLDRVSSRVLWSMRVVVPVGQFTREECGDRQVLSPGGVLVVASPWLPVPPFCFELMATPHWDGVLKSRCIKTDLGPSDLAIQQLNPTQPHPPSPLPSGVTGEMQCVLGTRHLRCCLPLLYCPGSGLAPGSCSLSCPLDTCLRCSEPFM